MTVLNFYAVGKRIPEGAVYIGRSGHGLSGYWGNPFTIGQDGDRAEVIKKYEEYLLDNPTLLEHAKRELPGKDLVCFCAPAACHGDVLDRLVNNVSETPAEQLRDSQMGESK